MANGAQPAEVRTRNIPQKGDWSNFFIAVIGGILVVWIPKIGTVLVSSTGGGITEALTDGEYWAICLLTALSAGVVVMFKYWEKTPHPWTLFVGVVSVPSLFAGTYNSSGAAYQASLLNTQINGYVAKAETTGKFLVGPNTEIPVIKWLGGNGRVGSRDSFSPGRSLSSFLITPAFAGEPGFSAQKNSLYGGLKVETPHAVVVLGQSQKRNTAEEILSTLQSKVPTAQLLDIGGHYVIVDSTRARPFISALGDAARLKNTPGLNPSVMSVPYAALKK